MPHFLRMLLTYDWEWPFGCSEFKFPFELDLTLVFPNSTHTVTPIRHRILLLWLKDHWCSVKSLMWAFFWKCCKNFLTAEFNFIRSRSIMKASRRQNLVKLLFKGEVVVNFPQSLLSRRLTRCKVSSAFIFFVFMRGEKWLQRGFGPTLLQIESRASNRILWNYDLAAKRYKLFPQILSN